MRVKRVLLMLESLGISGVAFSAQNLAKGLCAAGIEVTVLARRPGERAEDFRAAGAEVRVEPWLGVPLVSLRACARTQALDSEIIHAQSLKVFPLARKLAGRMHRPLVVTANRLEDMEASELRQVPGLAVVAVSEAIRERLINHGGLVRESIRVIPNGLDLSLYPRLDWDREPRMRHLPVIGTYGTLAPHKGQRVFLQAAAVVLGERGMDAEFLIMGQGPDKPGLRRLAAELGIANRVTFSPGTTTDAGNLRTIDIFVEPTFQEGLGLSVLQAMATGVPVIASGVGGIYSLVKDNETGVLVASGDVQGLAAAITDLLADEARRRELARSARELVESSFSMQQVTGRVLELYDELLAAGG